MGAWPRESLANAENAESVSAVSTCGSGMRRMLIVCVRPPVQVRNADESKYESTTGNAAPSGPEEPQKQSELGTLLAGQSVEERSSGVDAKRRAMSVLAALRDTTMTIQSHLKCVGSAAVITASSIASTSEPF